jgi:Uma2 family endonuclease
METLELIEPLETTRLQQRETNGEHEIASALFDDEAVESVYIPPTEWYLPDISKLITETDDPVDNIFSAKQQRLLVETLTTNLDLWNPPDRTVLMDANVGIFTTQDAPPLVPDAFVSVDIDEPSVFDYRTIRSYFMWVFGKAPDVGVEIVSNRKGKEMSEKRRKYARLHIPFYAVFDPFDELRGDALTVFELRRNDYVPMTADANGTYWFEEIGLGLKLWQGQYERSETTWLRWCNKAGEPIPTGFERSEDFKNQLHDTQRKLTLEQERAAKMAEKLRALGIEPDTL